MADTQKHQPAYVPAPEPVDTGRYLVGAMTCPLWKQGTCGSGWNAIVPFPERKPLLGWYDEDNPEVTDWEIKWALEHGINFFMACWFREKGNLGQPVKPILEHWLHESLVQSRYGDQFQFAILWENGNQIACGVESENDLLTNLLPYWIENYFQRPNYLRVDGKPVLFLYRPEILVRELGGVTQTRAALDKMREACQQAGLNGLMILGENHLDGIEPVREMADIGLDYSFSYHWPSFTKHMPSGTPPAPQELVDAQEACWQEQTTGPLAHILTVSMGWDSTPWGASYTSTRWHLTPDDFETLCGQARTAMDLRPPDQLDSRMILLDNWNEFGEGHYIFPTSQYRFGYLDAVRRAFSAAPQSHTDIVPEDVGLGPYDSRYRALENETTP